MERLPFVVNLLWAMGLGGLIGLERQLTGHIAGIRTCVLVCMGASLFTAFPFWIAGGDTSRVDVARVATQIVSGVGFLGSGIIFKDGSNVRGINTAATIWCTAAVGVFAGAGLHFPAAVAAVCLFGSNLVFYLLTRARLWGRFDDSGHVFQLKVSCAKKESAAVRAQLVERLSGGDFYLIRMQEFKAGEGTVCLEAKYACDSREFLRKNEAAAAHILALPGVQGADWAFLE